MFDATTSTDSTIQNTFIENSYKYASTISLFIATDFNNFDFKNSKDNSICDTISAGQKSRNTQVLEIMEHILHIMTDVGLHYTYPNDWGPTTSSTLYTCMQAVQTDGRSHTDTYIHACTYKHMCMHINMQARTHIHTYTHTPVCTTM